MLVLLILRLMVPVAGLVDQADHVDRADCNTLEDHLGIVVLAEAFALANE